MPTGSSAAPGRFVRVIHVVVRGLKRVAAYIDDVIVFDSDLTDHVTNIRILFKRLHRLNLERSPSNAQIGVTQAGFLDHMISPAGVSTNADNKVTALTKRQMPRDLKELRSLLGGCSYYRKCLPNMVKHVRLKYSLLQQGINFVFRPAMEAILGTLLTKISAPRTLVFPD